MAFFILSVCWTLALNINSLVFNYKRLQTVTFNAVLQFATLKKKNTFPLSGQLSISLSSCKNLAVLLICVSYPSPFQIQVWDTAGQERFRTITQSYYRSAHGAILAYDMTRRSTFESIPHWIHEIEKYGAANLVLMLIGKWLV